MTWIKTVLQGNYIAGSENQIWRFSLTCKPASSGRGNVLAGLCPKGMCD